MQNKLNYQKCLLQEIESIKSTNKKPKLLMHVCCGPCSTACLGLVADYFDITLLFYNPNIHPKFEYDKRYGELLKFVNIKNSKGYNIKIVNAIYNEQEYFNKVKGLEKEKEGGKRCTECFNLRLEYSAEYALENGFDYFTTTLTVSPHKNSQLINEIGNSLEKKYNIKYLFSDFKKNEGYKKSIELSREYNLYRQDYCGCIFSKLEREQQKLDKQKSV